MVAERWAVKWKIQRLANDPPQIEAFRVADLEKNIVEHDFVVAVVAAVESSTADYLKKQWQDPYNVDCWAEVLVEPHKPVNL